MIPLIGYADRLSGRPGDTIGFKVSSAGGEPFTARLVRIVCSDPNPAGPGILEEQVPADFAGEYPSRVQPLKPGSWGRSEDALNLDAARGLRLSALIWPTRTDEVSDRQTILAWGAVALDLAPGGLLEARVGDTVVQAHGKLHERHWYSAWMSLSADGRTLSVGADPLGHGGEAPRAASVPVETLPDLAAAPVTVAAALPGDEAGQFFNGKIEAPAIHADADGAEAALVLRWDFAREMSSTRVVDTGPKGLHGQLFNYPARAMTGASWTGEEMCWRHAPGQYGAIHFHDDDLYDAGWETDFSFTIPEDLPSGVYAARIACGGHEDAIPFFVAPPKGERRARLCVLVSTFTYAIYGNHARPDFVPAWKARFEAWNAYPWNPAEHPEYGLSTYNYHSDRSGICHGSHLRPLMNLKPGYLTFGYGEGSGLRHFPADTHLIAWLHAKGIDYDIVTDRELHEEGAAAIAGYKAVTTGTHPEYHTRETLDALQTYRDTGGRLIYLGGNGFYWRIAVHPENPAILEIRRGEGGIRAWAAEPGEYYNAFDGAYGGLWRRSGRPPQMLAGIGFSAQGQFEASYYRRRIGPDAPPSAAWIFEGVDDEIIGNFGLSAGGAAGFELDRADVRLGSPEDIEVVASSEAHGSTFVLVPEEQLTHITTWPGEPWQKLIRADMAYFRVPGGGEVFATGSITFCGSLPHNGFENNVSRVLENVMRRFLRD